MGLFSWFRKRADDTNESAALFTATADTAGLSRRQSPPRAPVAVPPHQMSATPSFTGEIVEDLVAALHDLAPEMKLPADRLLCSNLLRAVRNDGIQLPSMPEDVMRVQRLLASPDCAVHELSRAIQRDVSLAAKFIAVANSPVYAGTSRVCAVGDAAVRIGLNQSSMIVMAIVSKAKLFKIPGGREIAARLHRHALATASAAQVVARAAGANCASAFLSGLLHDLGRVFILSCAANIIRESRGERRVSPEVVERLSEILHAGFSALVAESWGYDAEITAAIQQHHLPLAGGSDLIVLIPAAEKLTQVLAVADELADVILDPSHVSPAGLGKLVERLGAGALEELLEASRAVFDEMELHLADEPANVAA